MEAILRKISKGPILKILDNLLNNSFGGLKSKLSVSNAKTLFDATGLELWALCSAAEELKQHSVGDHVSYVVNRNINFTNVCVKKCGFCAFSRTGIDEEGYFLPLPDILERSRKAFEYGASEICIQAGLPPNMDGNLYPTIASEVKRLLPQIHLHAFSPEEVKYGASRLKTSIKEYLLLLRQAGVDSLPGTSAEILDDTVRKQLASSRLSSKEWEDIITTAHEVGFKTTSTIMYGHIETTDHKVAHLHKIREIQERTGGITEFVPLSFVAAEAPIFKANALPGLRPGPSGEEVIKMHAISRLMLHGHINNIQVSWVKEGLRMSQVLLNCGVNDLGGTLLNESISTSAGASHGQMQTPANLRKLIWESGKQPVERFTDYKIRKIFSKDVEEHEMLDNVYNAEAEFGSFSSLIRSSDHRYRSAKEPRLRKHPNVQQQPFSSLARQQINKNVVTFSSSYTLVPTYECFNVCTYCNFRKQPGKDEWMSLKAAEDKLKALQEAAASLGPYQVKEILVMSGEVHPHSPRRASLIKRVRDICQLALDYGFWPHTNVGPLTQSEMQLLKEVNTSMGLMVEQTSQALLDSENGVHRYAPSKRPEVRIEQLEMAGKLRIPFTTGILVGIGESDGDRVKTLETIAEIHQKYHHIQECIIQPYSKGSSQKSIMQSFNHAELPKIVELARSILPGDIVIQVPPNLVQTPDILLACLYAGASDLGGISPKDEVNPDYPFQEVKIIESLLLKNGFQLCSRYAVHDSLLSWLPESMSMHLGRTFSFQQS